MMMHLCKYLSESTQDKGGRGPLCCHVLEAVAQKSGHYHDRDDDADDHDGDHDHDDHGGDDHGDHGDHNGKDLNDGHI